MAIDPALLEHIAGPAPAGGKPGNPPPKAPAQGGDKSEPVALHDACLELHETIKMAMQMAQDLATQIEMAPDVDPAAEQAIAQAADMITQAEGLLSQAEQSIGQGRGDYDDALDGTGTAEPPV